MGRGEVVGWEGRARSEGVGLDRNGVGFGVGESGRWYGGAYMTVPEELR